MRLKKLILTSLILMIGLVFYGCNIARQTVPKNGDTLFKTLDHYEANVRVTFLKDKQPNTIKLKQVAKMNGIYEYTVIEPSHLKDVKISYDGKKLSQYYPQFNKHVEGSVSQAQNEILLTSFVKRYLTNENIKEQELQLSGKKVVTYEMPIEGDFKYLAKEKIWIDTRTQTPVQLVIYDDEGNVTIEVIYEDFKINA